MENFNRAHRERGKPERREAITGRRFLEGNLPGTDTYDDGLNANGQLTQPGSTSTESGGMYMEEKGPNDLRHRGGDYKELEILDPEIRITDEPDAPFEEEDDEAARWLRENDPKLKN